MDRLPAGDRTKMVNPVVNSYRTSDGRFLSFILLQADKHWAQLCECIGRPELAADPRFVDMAARAENNEACIAILDEVFESQPLSYWKEALPTSRGCGCRSKPSTSSTKIPRSSPTAICPP